MTSRSADASEYEKLLQFLYLAPVGIVKFGADGSVSMMNPIATQLLLTVTGGLDISNFLGVLAAVSPDVHAEIVGFSPSNGKLCDQRSIAVLAGGALVTLSLTVVKIDDATYVASLLDVTAAAEAERKLVKLATTDALTGALNRRAFYDLLAHEIGRIQRYGGRAAVVMFDVDHFKRVNDTRGHEAGDVVLRAVARTARSTIRSVDYFGRIGGEEFGVLLPGTDAEGAEVVAEGLRTSIASMEAPHGDARLHVTASFGIAAFGKGRSSTDEIMAKADRAMYHAKASGRNRVALGSLAPEEGPSSMGRGLARTPRVSIDGPARLEIDATFARSR